MWSDAQVLSSVRLGPRAGNGIRPTAAAVDTRRNRLIVFCGETETLAAIDLSSHKVVLSTPLPSALGSDGYSADLIYNRRSDRLIVGRGHYRYRIGLFDPATLRMSRITNLGGDIPGAGVQYGDSPKLNREGTELYLCINRAGNMIHVLDANTLVRKREFRPEFVVTRTVCVGKWMVTLDGKQSLVVYQQSDGKFLARRSLPEIEQCDRLFVDDNRQQLIAVGQHSDTNGQRHNRAAVIRLPSLNTIRTVDLPDDEFYLWDSRSRTLIADDGWKPAAFDIESGKRTTFRKELPFSADGPIYLAVDSKSGVLFVALRNAVYAFRLSGMRLMWSGTVGAEVHTLLPAKQAGKSLVHYAADTDRLSWISDREQKVEASAIHRLHPLWSFITGLASNGTRTLLVGRDSLEWLNLNSGKTTKFDLPLEDPLHDAIEMRNGHGLLAVIFPEHTDLTDQKARIEIFEDGKRRRLAEIGSLPETLLYVEDQDAVYFLREKTIQRLDGPTVSLPKLSNPEPRRIREFETVEGSGDVDTTGRFAYYCPPGQAVLLKLRVTDGYVVAGRKLTFHPRRVAVFSRHGHIILLDWLGGRVVRVKLF